MRHKLRPAIWVMAALVLAGPAGAQSPFNLDSPKSASPAGEVGGKTSIDLIRLTGATPSVPLRNAGIVEGSEFVELDGRTLKRGVDYAIDRASGTIYLMRPVRAGQALRVTYRHDPKETKAPTSALGVAGLNGFSFDFAPGATMMLGFGMAERQVNGAVLQSNVYGLKTNFSLGKNGAAKGLFVLSDRQQVHAESLFDYQGEAKAKDAGKSQALVQSLSYGALGGKIEADLQDVRKEFSSWQSFRSAGYDEGAIKQFEKERGLKRMGLRLTDVGSGALKFSSGFKSVKVDDASIEWRSLGMKAGSFQVQWNGQRVDKDFNRFQDLAEGDRDQLAKEKGLNRETISSSLALKGGAANYESLKVEDLDGSGIHRRRAGLDWKGLKLRYADQHVEEKFNRFGHLREGDAGQLAREKGIRRQEIGLETPAFAKWAPTLRYQASSLRTDKGDFRAVDFGLAGTGWSVDAWSRAADPGLQAIGAMAEPEIQGHMKAIARMYETGDVPFRPEDRNAFLQGAGIERHALRLSLTPLKGLTLGADQIRLEGRNDSGLVQTFRLATPNVQASYREQRLGDKLDEVNRLMEFEKQRLSPLPGLQRTDAAFAIQLGGGRSLAASQTRIEAPQGEAYRHVLSFKDRSLDFELRRRSVDASFGDIRRVVDPERELLADLLGFDQTDLTVGWRPIKNLQLNARWTDAESPENGRQRVFRDTRLVYAPFKGSRIEYQTLKLRNDEPTQLLAEQKLDRYTINQDLGKAGAVQYAQESKVVDGEQADQPDYRRQSMVYETKLDGKTMLKAEQVRTEFDDGKREEISSQTLSTEIAKRAGVSVNHTRIDRNQDQPDEARRNYGFWLDVGGGVRINYGYARNLKDEARGTLDSTFGMTPGVIGGIKIDQFGYQIQRWDEQRNRHVGNVAIASAAPIQLGFLRDFQFVFGANTLRDNNAWAQENRRMAVSTKIGGNALAWSYYGQINPQGDRAIDRTFMFATDQSDKNPLRFKASYKVRTLPNNDSVMIRDYSLAWRVAPGFEVSHQLLTNPEAPDGNVLLQSRAQATRVNRWKLDYTRDPRTKFAFSFDEAINDQTRALSRITGLNVTLFANNPSPLQLFYGVEQREENAKRRTMHRYHLRFDQRPGPNQMLSLFLGNVSWQHSRAEDQKVQNWALRMEYQLRF